MLAGCAPSNADRQTAASNVEQGWAGGGADGALRFKLFHNGSLCASLGLHEWYAERCGAVCSGSFARCAPLGCGNSGMASAGKLRMALPSSLPQRLFQSSQLKLRMLYRVHHSRQKHAGPL